MNWQDQRVWLRKEQAAPVPVVLKGEASAKAVLYEMDWQDRFDIVEMKGGFLIFRDKDGLQGLMDWKGRVLIPAVWHQIAMYLECKVVVCRRAKSYVLFNLEGDSILFPGKDRKALLANLPRLLSTEGVVVLDLEGREIVCEVLDPFYGGYITDEKGSFFGAFARVKRDGRVGYIHATGLYCMDSPFKDAGPMVCGYASYVQKKNDERLYGIGFMDFGGREAFPAEFSEVLPFSEGFAAVKLGEGWMYISTDRDILECYAVRHRKKIKIHGFAAADSFHNGYARVRRSGDLTPIYLDPSFKNGLCECWGLINQEGKLTIPMNCTRLSRVYKGGFCLFGRRFSETYGVITAEGEVLIPEQYREILPLPNGCFELSDGYKKGAANAKGKIIAEPQFTAVSGITEEGVCVQKNEKWGLLDEQGEVVIPVRYSREFGFSNGIAVVIEGNEGRLIDRRGETVSSLRFSDVSCLDIGFAMVEMNGVNYVLDYGFNPESMNHFAEKG